MATLLDMGLVGYFSVIFPVLLVFAVLYAIFRITKIFGEHNTIAALVAVILALATLLSPSVLYIVKVAAPWVILLIIFILFLALIFGAFGMKGSEFTKMLTENPGIKWTMFSLLLIILIGSMIFVLGQPKGEKEKTTTVNETKEPTIGEKVKSIFFNTKVLGFIFLFFVAMFAILLLTSK